MSVVVGICMLSALPPSLACAAQTAESIVASDFTDVASIPSKSTLQAWWISTNGGTALVENDGDIYGNYMRVVSGGSSASDTNAVYKLTESDGWPIANQVIFSYDVRLHQENQYYKVKMNDWTNMAGDKKPYESIVFTENGKVGYVESGDPDGAFVSYGDYSADRWYHIDTLLDFSRVRPVASYYIDGLPAGSTELGSQTLANKKIGSLYFCSVDKKGPLDRSPVMDVDNVRLGYVDDGSFFAEVIPGDTYLDVLYSEAVPNLSDVTYHLERVNGAVAVDDISVKVHGVTAARLTYSSPLEVNEEYRLSITGAQSALEEELASRYVYLTVEQEQGPDTLLQADFDTHTPDYAISENNGSGPVDSGNAEYRNAYHLNGSKNGQLLGFDLGERISADSVTLCFDIKPNQQNAGLEVKINDWYPGQGQIDPIAAYPFILVSNQNIALSKNGGSPFIAGGSGSVWISPYKTEWYHVKVQYDLKNRKVNYQLNGADKGTFDVRDDVLTDGVKTLTFYSGNANTNMTSGVGYNSEGASWEIDNIKITAVPTRPVMGTATVNRVRMEDYAGIVYTPDPQVDPKISRFALTFQKEMDVSSLEEGVFLQAQGQSVPVTLTYENKICTLQLLDGALLPETEYTLSVRQAKSADGLFCVEDYSYTFTTGSGGFEVLSFQALKNGQAISVGESVRAGDVLSLQYEILNTTGNEKSVYVSYAAYHDDKMTDYDFAEPVIVNGYCADTALRYTVSEEQGFDFKGFVWNSLEGMTPYAEAAGINH